MTTTKDLVPVVQKEITPVVAKAQALTITGPADMTMAAEMLSQLNKAGDTLEESREKLTKPLNATLKEIRSRYKPLESTIEEAVGIIRRKMGDYQLAAERAAKEEEEKIAGRVGEGRGKLKPETAANKLMEIERPDAAVVAESGMVKFRTDQKLKVTDLTTLVRWLAEHEPTTLDYNERDVLALLKRGDAVEGAVIEEVKTPINIR